MCKFAQNKKHKQIILQLLTTFLNLNLLLDKITDCFMKNYIDYIQIVVFKVETG